MVGEMASCGNVVVRKCLVGKVSTAEKVSFGEVPIWILSSGKCQSGNCPETLQIFLLINNTNLDNMLIQYSQHFSHKDLEPVAFRVLVLFNQQTKTRIDTGGNDRYCSSQLIGWMSLLCILAKSSNNRINH